MGNCTGGSNPPLSAKSALIPPPGGINYFTCSARRVSIKCTDNPEHKQFNFFSIICVSGNIF
jgi:hypothetical protein